MTPWLLGWVAGTAAQLQQAQLWPCGAYQALLAAALLGVPVAGWLGRCGLRCPREGWAGIWLLCGALAGAGWAGARAAAHASDLLAPALEEAVLLVSGRVAGLPQRHADGGQRFAFDLTGAATPDGRAVRAPSRLWLAWHPPREAAAGGAPPIVRAGDHWRLPVRLKRPHGERNPHGFDRERWL